MMSSNGWVCCAAGRLQLKLQQHHAGSNFTRLLVRQGPPQA
jgi:hypothetical protein